MAVRLNDNKEIVNEIREGHKTYRRVLPVQSRAQR